MNKKLLSTLLVAAGFAITAQAQIPTEMTDRFQTVMDSLTANVHTTGTNESLGISFAITIPGYGSWQGVSGQAGGGVPLTTDMTMGIASHSKLYTAVILLKLQEAGVLSLDDAIGEHFDAPIPNVDMTITIRQLLQHQSGIYDSSNEGNVVFWENVFTDWTVFWDYEDLYTMIEAPNFSKGTAFRYSNMGYSIAANIIENATGNSYSHNLHQYITTPLGLDMTFDAAEDTEALDAIQESQSYTVDTWWPRLGSVAAASLIRGAGSIVATPQDVVDFYQALFNTQFLSEQSMEQLLDFEKSSVYGLGIQTAYSPSKERDILYHGGSWVGFLSEITHDPLTGASYYMSWNSDQLDVYMAPPLHIAYADYFPKKVNDAGIFKVVSPVTFNCAATQLPVVELRNYGSNALTSVAVNYKVDNGTAQVHNWTGNLASGESVEINLPAIAASEGNHTLTAWTSVPNASSEGNLYNDQAVANFIVNPADNLPATFSEGFEAETSLLHIWNTDNTKAHQWGVTPLVSNSGNRSLGKDSMFNANIGGEEFIDLPILHLGAGSQQLNFSYAYRTYGDLDNSLEVLVSDDCGTTWTSIFNKQGSELGYGQIYETIYFAPYYPMTDDEWHDETVSLDNYTNDNLLIRFKQVNGGGGNIYLDDIYVGSALGIADRNSNMIKVYPNPASDKVTVVGLPEGTVVSLHTISGQKLMEVVANGDTAIDISSLAKGMYFLNTAKGSAKIIKE